MPINGCRELSTEFYESSGILPFGHAALHLEGAGLKSLRSLGPLWITLESTRPSKRAFKKKGKSPNFGYNVVAKHSPKGGLP